ncbi:MAG: hypothetical protein JKY41_04350 [Rhodobacteraceae bacterium]|nr:hypothetical protein [Paracoccaceae bacterium]
MEYTEDQIRDGALTELSASSSGHLTTTQLIEILSDKLKPTGHDAEILSDRSDTYFSQKVRNLVSHRNQGTGLVARGLATYDEVSESWTITPLGRASI